jgi:hypothetical protein
MCLIHIDESATRLDSCMTVTSLCTFSEKLDNLLDCLDNQRTMHGSQNGALEWACGNQNDAHYCSRVILHTL